MAPVHTILAVDDRPDALYALERILAKNGYRVVTATSGDAAIEAARSVSPSLVLCDVMMPGIDGYEVAKRFKSDPELRFIPVFLVTARDSLQDVVSGFEAGADGYIAKPYEPDELLARVHAALRLRDVYQELRLSTATRDALMRTVEQHNSLREIVGDSPEIRSVLGLVAKVAPAESSVLITGASGTGKELVARAIHYASPRQSGPFVAANCAALTEQLIESELFGHRRGSFTGAFKDRQGFIEAAEGGTLFFDEVGDLPLEAQAKLLRVLQEGTFIPVGDTAERRCNVRFLFATNKFLEELVRQGKFREDLFYRIHVIAIDLPPLLKRRSDIPQLAKYFLAKKSPAIRKAFTPDAIAALEAFSWPGNIRELENEVERVVILSGSDEEIGLDVLSPRIVNFCDESLAAVSASASLPNRIAEVEREMILAALRESGGNKSSAAKRLGISRSSLIAKTQQYQLERK